MDNRRNNKLIINLLATIIQFVINYGITFFFTPYLVRTVGSEAYGFVSLANSMVNYATIITVALSSVAGRFITIKIHQGKKVEANEYFNSVLIANIILALVIGVIFIPIIYNLQSFLQIPEDIYISVKLLFIFIVLNFMITVASNVFTVGTFITNKLYLTNIGNCISALLRIFLLWFMFGIFPAEVFYIGITSCICSLFLTIYNAFCTIYLDTGLKINLKVFSISKIIEMISSGIWSSITKLSQVLSDGLDMLISNIWIGSYEMGQLSIAYTIPTLCASILSNIAGIFNPQQTYYYAKGDINGVVNEIKLNMKMTGFFMGIIFAGIIAFGYNFFELWTPTENLNMIYKLSCISIISVLASGVAASLNSVFLITNHLKVNSIIWLIISVLNCSLVLVLVKFTDLGVYAVAGVSKFSSLIIYLTYSPIYASICLGVSKKTFYPIILRYFICSIILTIVMSVTARILPQITSWKSFIMECVFAGIIGIIFNGIFFLKKSERKFLIDTIKKKIFKINVEGEVYERK